MAGRENPVVSVVIPAYNAERYLAEAIESVLAQTYPDVECIVVDDGSTDGTREVAAAYAGKVIYLSQENSERSAARNNGIAHASGKYVSFLDADDRLAEEKVARQVRFLEEHPDYGAVYSRVRFFRDGEKESRRLDRITPAGDLLANLVFGNFITVNSPLICKEAVEKAGGFDTRLSLNEDWDLFLRLAAAGTRFGFIAEDHAFCRFHGANTSSDEVRMHEAKLQVAKSFVSRFGAELNRRGIVPGKVVSYHQADYGKALIVAGRGAEGRREIYAAALSSRFPGWEKYVLFGLASFLLGKRAVERIAAGPYRQSRG